MTKPSIFFAALALLSSGASAQTTVTRILSDFNGFWSSQTTAVNPVQPDSSHMLLGFSYGSEVYSTGVADSILTAHNVPFQPALFNAFQPSSATIMKDNSTVIGVGYKYGGPGNVDPIPVQPVLSDYLQDGVRGLDLGTAIFNAVPGNILYTINATNDTAIADGRPDILVTQVGEPPAASSKDSFRFIDINGITVGHAVAVSVSSLPVAGNASWKFYNTGTPITYNAGLLGSRPLRMVAFDFADFGITTANIGSVKHFVHRVSGESDQAFVAYNTTSFSPGAGQPLAIDLTDFGAQKAGNAASLNWTVANTQTPGSFIVERTSGDNLFKAIGEVACVQGKTRYAFTDAAPEPGMNLYRLKIAGRQEPVRISKVVALDFSAADFHTLSVFPNPVKDVITMASLTADDVVFFRNSIGVEMSQVVRAGNVFDLSRLPAGVYVLTVVHANAAQQSKVIVKE